jgi:heme/copper-type cytochrome/quinol oxidase subunit 2
MENEKLKITNTIFMIIELTSGVLMFSGKSLFWSTISFMFGIFFQCLILLGTIMNNENDGPQEIIKLLYERGAFMFLYIFLIIGIYAYCIWISNENVMADTMPKQWSWYSWIIAVIVLVILTPIMNAQITNAIDNTNTNSKDNQQNGIIAAHFLFIFVYIQYIISMFYQTDGFRV